MTRTLQFTPIRMPLIRPRLKLCPITSLRRARSLRSHPPACPNPPVHAPAALAPARLRPQNHGPFGLSLSTERAVVLAIATYDRAVAIAGNPSARSSDVSAATAARRRPMDTAAADPASDSTADTTSAGRYPATTPAAEASEPCAVNTAVTMATPSAPEADVGIDIEMPTPAMISGATNCP